MAAYDKVCKLSDLFANQSQHRPPRTPRPGGGGAGGKKKKGPYCGVKWALEGPY